MDRPALSPSTATAPRTDDALSARHGGRTWLAAALQASRADTLSTFSAFEATVEGLRVPERPTINPPLWELGHIGWFQSWWLARNPERARGLEADPDATRAPDARRPGADALYDSGRVPHARRGSLPLPDADATRADLALQLDATLALLHDAPDDDRSLYFFRLALLHEDMHHEAALYTAAALGIAIADPRWQPRPLADDATELAFEAGDWPLGSRAEAGFAFDNELASHPVRVAACRIDRQVLSWRRYLPFVEAGGYDDARCWTAAGLAWRQAQGRGGPQRLRPAGRGRWEQWRHGAWIALDPDLPAMQLNFFEAEAWCRWAGRRLPTEAEWERAAIERPEDFRWGEVWEWTASAFAPYPGFVAHPYRDYSAPWFDGRPVLRGASFATQPRLRHARYRNFFEAGRDDLFAGLRSCAIDQG